MKAGILLSAALRAFCEPLAVLGEPGLTVILLSVAVVRKGMQSLCGLAHYGPRPL